MNPAQISTVRTILVAALAAALSCWMTWGMLGPQPPERVPGSVPDPVLQELAGLATRLDEAMRLRVPQTVPLREPMGPPADEGRLGALLQRLERLVAGYPASLWAGQVALDRRAPVNWPEVASLETWFRSDRKAAERSVQLLTPTEAMERFGFPSRIVAANADGGGMCWMYERPGPDGEELNDITLWFQDGYLLHLMN